MAASMRTEKLMLIDEETNNMYTVEVQLEDAERARNDVQFATTLLEHAKQCSPSPDVSLPDENPDVAISKEQHNWTKQQTLLLIEIYKKKERDFHDGKNTIKHCWETVSKEMKKMGHNISGRKCSIKFQAMKRTYKAIKDHNKRSGNSSKPWEYFDLMDNVFGEKPWVEPVAVAGTSCDFDSESSSTKETSASNEISKKRKTVNIANYLDRLLEEKRLKREADEKQHEEKMKRLDDLKNVLQTFIEKY